MKIDAFVDNMIGLVSPMWKLRRAMARASYERLQNATGHSGIDQLQTSGGSGYTAARMNRLTRAGMAGRMNENEVPRAQVSTLRQQSWDLFRNNGHARKICRQLEAKVVGRGLQPLPLAINRDGSPFREWRRRVRRLWRDIGGQIDHRGRPGKGGQHLTELMKTALRGTVLGGEILYRFRRLTERQQRERGLLLPLQIQLIHADRLNEQKTGVNIFYGIEFNARDERSYYHLWTYHPSDDRFNAEESRRIKASDIGHLYVSDDIEQVRGTPWYSAALLKMRDVGDYEYNELQAAAMSACVVLGYRRSTGQTQFGIDAPSDWDLEDADGNKITNISPGMLLDLGVNGEIQGFNPGRPNADAPEFINHMIRAEAASVPGIKPTSLTGDYRGSSFSSERSSENDVWPELEGVQDWMAWNMANPIYEEIVTAAVAEGYFDDISGFSAADFTNRKSDYLYADWRGPVGRSINPKDDSEAGRRRMKSLTSSPQREAALVGANLQDVLEEWSDFVEQLEGLGLPAEEIIQSLLGITPDPGEIDESNEGDEDGDTSQKTNAAATTKRAAASNGRQADRCFSR